MFGNIPRLIVSLETFCIDKSNIKGCYVFMQPIRSFLATTKELSQVLVVRENG